MSSDASRNERGEPQQQSSFLGFGGMSSSTSGQQQQSTITTGTTDTTSYSGFGGMSSNLGSSYASVGTGEITDSQTDSAIKASINTFGSMSASAETPQGRGWVPSRSTQSSTTRSNLFGTTSGTYSDTNISRSVQFSSLPVKHEDTDRASGLDENVSDSDIKTEGPTYGLFCVPAEGIDPSYCLKYKGSGPTFCLLKNCKKNHNNHDRTMELKPLHGYVQKVVSAKVPAALDVPAINLQGLADDYRDEIMTSKKTIDEWMELAGIAASLVNAGVIIPITEHDIKVSRTKREKYKSVQSPMLHKVRKQLTENKLDRTSVPDFSSSFFPEATEGDLSENDLKEIIAKLDNNLVKIKNFLDSFYSLYSDDHKNLFGIAESSEVKFSELFSSIGIKPKNVGDDFEVPSLWAGYGTILQILKQWAKALNGEIKTAIEKSSISFSNDLGQAVAEFDQKISNISDSAMKLTSLEKRVNLLEPFGYDVANTIIPQQNLLMRNMQDLQTQSAILNSFSAQATTHIKNHNTRIGSLEQELQAVKQQMQQQQTSAAHQMNLGAAGYQPGPYKQSYHPQGHPQGMQSQMVQPQWTGGFGTVGNTGFGSMQSTPGTQAIDPNIAARISKLESSIQVLVGNKDRKSIKIGNLGINSLKDSEAWLAMNHPEDDFEHLVDLHIGMEHIAEQLKLSGTDILDHMHKSSRLNISNLNQAYTVQSFDRRFPKFLHATGKHAAVPITDSHLPGLSSYAAWSKPEDGDKATLEEQLGAFVSSFTTTIEDALQDDYSVYYTLCMLALSSTENFIIAMMAFVEEMYLLYSNAHYSPAHAWHIVTMLLKSIILKIAEPRIGIASRFSKNNMKGSKALIFYTVLQCLDIMDELRLIKLKNDNGAAMDLIRFVSRNPESYKIVNLEKKNSELESKLKELQRKFDELIKKVSDGKSNTHDDSKLSKSVNDLKSQVTNHTKKLKGIEQRLEKLE